MNLNNATNGRWTAYLDRIPSEKALVMRGVCKLYDIPVKTRKKKGQPDQFGQFDDIPPSPELKGCQPPHILAERLTFIESDNTGLVEKPAQHGHATSSQGGPPWFLFLQVAHNPG
jgi:hypothetical protein